MSSHLLLFDQPARPVPTREMVCNGQTTQQGLTVTTSQFGAMPWWGGCWAWLSSADRAVSAEQLIGHGDRICVIQVALDGRALYDEPDQFYSPDKFPELTQTLAQTVALVREAIDLGFDAVWLFLDGDDGAAGYPVAVAQVQALAPLMGPLNQYVCYMPGWDGVWHVPEEGGGTGYSREQLQSFTQLAREAGAIYVGVEHGTGYLIAGKGADDYAPGGVMTGYDVILGEFNDGQFDDTVWQILGRMVRPYVRDPEQPSGDDPSPPFDLASPSERGVYYYRIFEYYIYGAVRGVPNSVIAAARARFALMAPTNVIC
jgi:hypothetical protein